MPETLKASEVNAQNDPSVAKQYDTETPKDEQIKDFYGIVDKIAVGMLTTHREGTGLVSRSMATAKREGPDFYFICNKHSKKFSEIQKNPEVMISYEDSSTKNWISISGKASVTSNDSKIEELYSKPISAWFGDLGDGKHDGGPTDPRMSMIHVKSNHIIYYKTEVGALGYAKEIAVATVTGKVANTGSLREFNQTMISSMRQEA